MPAHILSVRPVAAQPSFRQYLQAELARRCGRNPRYSLRAFADFLGTDHATLSQMMRGRRPCSAASIRRLGARLGLSVGEIADFVARQALPESKGDAAEVRHLAEDAASVIADWRAFAILELMRLADFQTDVRWIARMLGVEPDSVNIALQHLLRLGFLRMEAPDRWLDLTGGVIYSQEAFTVLALERLAQRSHSLQLASARNAPESPRLHGAVTLAVDQVGLARLLALSERFLAEAGQGDRQGEVLYQVEVHCFPISAAGGMGQ